jgi:hypothetical protein
VAAGDAGTELIEKLHALTGAEIAASANPTGNKALGGDWNLAVKTSEFDVELAVTPEVQKSYGFVLGTSIDEVTIGISSEPEQTVTLKNQQDEEIEGDFSVGDNNALVVQSFIVNDNNNEKDFKFNQPLENFAIQRNDNTLISGEKQLI